MMRDRRRLRVLVVRMAAGVTLLMAAGMLAGCSTDSKMPEADKANFKGSRPPDNFTPPSPTHGAQPPANK
jgi:hypothetical protein